MEQDPRAGLKGRTAVVAGSSSGIGRAIAMGLAPAGFVTGQVIDVNGGFGRR